MGVEKNKMILYKLTLFFPYTFKVYSITAMSPGAKTYFAPLKSKLMFHTNIMATLRFANGCTMQKCQRRSWNALRE